MTVMEMLHGGTSSSDGGVTLRAPGRDPVRADSPDVHAWLTEFLGVPSTLVRPPAGNAHRLHVVSRASLAESSEGRPAAIAAAVNVSASRKT